MAVKTGKKKELLYVTAFDKNGVLVKAKDAEKTESYFCPECKYKLILKKSGKTGKNTKRPHFAHYSQSPNCTPEGVLHKSFKLLLLEKIKNNITNKIPINIEWECIYCHEKHNGNLIQAVIDAKDEYQMENCRADIALFCREGDPFAVIEIIVTHKPEETAIEYYKSKKIILIQIELNSEDDLENIDTIINKPTSINYCFNPKCPNIKEYVFKRQAIVIKKLCGYFHAMRSLTAETLHYFGLLRSNNFTENEIEFARKNGVRFDGKNIICPQCRAIRSRYRPRIF